MARAQRKQGQRKTRKLTDSEQKTVLDERRFKEIRDLLYIEFCLDGFHDISVYDALPVQMNVLAETYANVSNVDVNVWPIEERLDFVNNLWDFCQKRGYQFPLQIKETKRLVETIDQLPNSHSSVNLVVNLES
jgi:spore cortex formation protein SpoVR/YcgB (stage V sporulation)